jgi:hypothetical protein
MKLKEEFDNVEFLLIGAGLAWALAMLSGFLDDR